MKTVNFPDHLHKRVAKFCKREGFNIQGFMQRAVEDRLAEQEALCKKMDEERLRQTYTKTT